MEKNISDDDELDLIFFDSCPHCMDGRIIL